MINNLALASQKLVYCWWLSPMLPVSLAHSTHTAKPLLRLLERLSHALSPLVNKVVYKLTSAASLTRTGSESDQIYSELI